MTIRAVLFDLDGTLLDRAQSLVRFIDMQYHKIEALQCVSYEEYLHSFVALDKNGYVWKDQVYQQLIERYNIKGVTWGALLADYVENFVIAATGFPYLREMLEQLKGESYLLGLVTNGRSPFQEHNITALNIQSFFSTILVSEAVGLRKPEQAIFKRALSDLSRIASTDIQPIEAVFVGDSCSADIGGARTVGMKTVWKCSPAPSEDVLTCEEADDFCHSLAQLPEIIHRL